MMLPMSPSDLDRLVKDRQGHLRESQRTALERPGLRVRVGRTLIAAGTALSGERVEQPARPSHSLRRATRPTS